MDEIMSTTLEDTIRKAFTDCSQVQLQIMRNQAKQLEAGEARKFIMSLCDAVVHYRNLEIQSLFSGFGT